MVAADIHFIHCGREDPSDLPWESTVIEMDPYCTVGSSNEAQLVPGSVPGTSGLNHKAKV